MAKGWLQAKRFKMKIYRAKARGVKDRFSSEKVSVGRSVNKEGMRALYSKRALSVTSKDLSVNIRSEPRQEVERTEPLRYFRLLDDAFARARLYYSSNPEYCYILELDRRTGSHRRSIKYLDRDIAYGRYCDGSIDWSPKFYHERIPETFQS